MNLTVTPSSRANMPKRNDLVFIEPPHQHAIDFQRPQTRPACSADARQYVIVSIGHARDAREAVRIDCVHRNRNASQARVFQGLCQFGQHVPVCRKCDVELFTRTIAVRWAKAGKLAHELNYALAQQRLSAGQANLVDAHVDKHARHAQIILEGQVTIQRALIAGAAIDTLVVAAVGDGDPQICDGAAEFVEKGQKS